MTKEKREIRLQEIEAKPQNKSSIGFACSLSENAGMHMIVKESDYEFLISQLRTSWEREEIFKIGLNNLRTQHGLRTYIDEALKKAEETK